ncbi:MAG: PilN domain-containing protein [Acidobacteriota bacterium]
MIRINLISEGRRPVVARKSKPKLAIGDQDPSLYILAAGLVVGLLVALGIYLSLNATIKGKRTKILAAQKTVKELKPILEEVEDFKRKKRRLSRKIEIITDLDRKRRGPVSVMDSVSRALPELVWLNNMQVRGKRTTLKCRTLNFNAIAAFIENLKKVPEFDEPNTQNIKRGRAGTYSFDIIFRFEPPKPPEEEKPEGEDAEAAEG